MSLTLTVVTKIIIVHTAEPYPASYGKFWAVLVQHLQQHAPADRACGSMSVACKQQVTTQNNIALSAINLCLVWQNNNNIADAASL